MQVPDHTGSQKKCVADLIIVAPASFYRKGCCVNIKRYIAARTCGYADGASQLRNHCNGTLQRPAFLERVKVLHAIGISNKFANKIRCQAHGRKMPEPFGLASPDIEINTGRRRFTRSVI